MNLGRMKKRNKIIALLLISMPLFFSACEDDRDSTPTLLTPTAFVLNTPPYASSTVYDLENSSNVELTCPQPDYGFTAATLYSVQISVDNDFTHDSKYTTLATT